MATESPAAPVDFDAEDARIRAMLNVDTYNDESVYNFHGWKPVRQELQQIPVRSSGTIPDDLEGVYLRNGTNMQFEQSGVWSHAFNHAGMLHEIQIRNGAGTYSNTYIRTPRFLYENAVGREIYLNFTDVAGAGRAGLDKIKLLEAKRKAGVVPDFSPLEATPGSTAVQYHAGHIYCLQETGYAFRLNHKMQNGRLILDGTGVLETWDGTWDGPFSAHPRIDPDTGDFFSIANDRYTNRIMLGQLSNGEVTQSVCVFDQSQETDSMSWVHDYFLTANHIVFPDVSMRYSQAGLLSNTGSVFKFNPDYKMRFGVLPRQFKPGDSIRWFETNTAAVIWHVANAWERTGADGHRQIVCYSPKFHDYPSSVPIHTPEEPPAKLTKWVLDLDTGEVVEEKVLIEHGYERPSVNLARIGKESRYIYLLDEERAGYMGKGVLKFDTVEEKEAAYFDYGDFFGGEALFVPRKGATDEDDGYLLELLMGETRADLVIIDARTMTELGRLHLPQRVPFGVHACWLNKEKLDGLA